MNAADFREFGKATVDYIADYLENIRERPVLSTVQPGYLQHLIPKEVPSEPDDWRDILKDMEKVIMPGVTHWHSPNFHAYYPTGSSYPSIIGEMLSASIGCVGFSWITSPACTELEVIMMDWLGKLINLPKEFLNSSEGPGGGVIQGSASEATLVGLLAAKERTLRQIQSEHPDWDDGAIKAKLIAYTSVQSNSSVEKAGLLGSMPMRMLPTNREGRLRGQTLQDAIDCDRAKGLIPCYVVATLGTTGTCAYDCLEELGPICKKENLWLHVDAAYAGCAMVCPEYQYLMAGVQYADSYNFNPHKWLLVNFDCSAMWMKDTNYLVDAFSVERIYLKHKSQGENACAPDFRNLLSMTAFNSFESLSDNDGWHNHVWSPFSFPIIGISQIVAYEHVVSSVSEDDSYELEHATTENGHWQIPLGRRFRALKLWLTLRIYGVKGLQDHIRKHVSLAKCFETLVSSDDRFQLTMPATLGLVCFRVKSDGDHLTQELLDRLTAEKKLYMVPAKVHDQTIIRFVICSRLTELSDIAFAWQEIQAELDAVLKKHNIKRNHTNNVIKNGKKLKLEQWESPSLDIVLKSSHG